MDKRTNSAHPYMKYYISMAIIIPITIVLTYMFNANIISIKTQYASHIVLAVSSIINIILYKKAYDLQHDSRKKTWSIVPSNAVPPLFDGL